MTQDVLLAELLNEFPQAALKDPAPGFREICFPHLPGNDYWYYATFGSLLQLSACLAPYGEPQPAFWLMPFECAGDPTEADLAAFRDALFAVLRHPTRITQLRGLLFTMFRCEVHHDGAWKRVFQNGYLRLTIRDLPRIAGRRHVYSAAELVSGRT